MDISKTKSLTVPEIAFIAAIHAERLVSVQVYCLPESSSANNGSSWVGVYFVRGRQHISIALHLFGKQKTDLDVEICSRQS